MNKLQQLIRCTIVSAVCVGSLALAPQSMAEQTAKADTQEAFDSDINHYVDELAKVFASQYEHDPYQLQFALERKYGKQRFAKAVVREVHDRGHEEMMREMLSTKLPETEGLSEIAVGLLASDKDKSRGEAIYWLVKNPDRRPDRVAERLPALVLDVFVDSRGQEGLWELRKLGTKKQLPAIRRLYARHFKDDAYSIGKGRSPYAITDGFRPAGVTRRSAVLLLMAQLGDRDTRQKIHKSLVQKDQPQRRAWGLVMAAKLGDKRYLPQVTAALDDDRRVPEAIYSGMDETPEQKEAVASQATVYTRVRDMAVRTVDAIANPGEDWPFEVPGRLFRRGFTTGLQWFQVAAFPYREQVGRYWDKPRRSYHQEYVVGFTDKQITLVRKWIEKAQADRQTDGHRSIDTGTDPDSQ